MRTFFGKNLSDIVVEWIGKNWKNQITLNEDNANVEMYMKYAERTPVRVNEEK